MEPEQKKQSKSDEPSPDSQRGPKRPVPLDITASRHHATVEGQEATESNAPVYNAAEIFHSLMQACSNYRRHVSNQESAVEAYGTQILNMYLSDIERELNARHIGTEEKLKAAEGQIARLEARNQELQRTKTKLQQTVEAAKQESAGLLKEAADGGTSGLQPTMNACDTVVAPRAVAEVKFDMLDPPMHPVLPPSEHPILDSTDQLNIRDVLCEHGGLANAQNRHFRKLVQEFQPVYRTVSKRQKTAITRTVVLIVRQRGGCFLEKCESSGELKEIGDARAHTKVTQTFREQMDEQEKEKEGPRSSANRQAAVVKPLIWEPQHFAVEQPSVVASNPFGSVMPQNFFTPGSGEMVLPPEEYPMASTPYTIYPLSQVALGNNSDFVDFVDFGSTNGPAPTGPKSAPGSGSELV